MTRGVVVLVMVALGGLALGSCSSDGTAGPASASTPSHVRYVALGDSYSSGSGAGRYTDVPCQRSAAAFPVELASALSRTRLVMAACAGATTADVLSQQVDTLTRATRLVTITIGGNDVDFVGAIGACARRDVAACDQSLTAIEGAVRDRLPAVLEDTYLDIRGRAPRATVFAVGYAAPFSGSTCPDTAGVTGPEQRRVVRLVGMATTVMRKVASAARVHFIDAQKAFLGHKLCSAEPWFAGASAPLGSFHPNAAGHRLGYLRVVARAVRRATR